MPTKGGWTMNDYDKDFTIMDDKIPDGTLHFIGSHPDTGSPLRALGKDGGLRITIDVPESEQAAVLQAYLGLRGTAFHVAIWPASGNGQRIGDWE